MLIGWQTVYPKPADNYVMASKHKVVVLGDQMVDVYQIGTSSRVSAEVPVPIVKVTDTVTRPGGAANVAANLGALGCSVITPHQFIMPVKNRLMVGDYQVARWDRDECSENVIPDSLVTYIKKHADALVISDYQKGALSQETLDRVLVSIPDSLPVFVDTKADPSTRFQACTSDNLFFFPNEAEYNQYTQGYAWSDAHIILKRSAKGARWFGTLDNSYSAPSEARWVRSVNGAGDTVLAGFVKKYLDYPGLRDVTRVPLALDYAMKCAGRAVEGSYTSVVTEEQVYA